MSNFKIGDVVQLKSGGPRMTVTVVLDAHEEGPSVRCNWFDVHGKVALEVFPVDAVETKSS